MSVLYFDGRSVSSNPMGSYPTALQSENVITRVDEDSANRGVTVERTDRQLVDLVLAGDEFAFEQIFDRHKRMVAAVAARYYRRPEQIEEIIQMSFSKAFVELAQAGVDQAPHPELLTGFEVNADQRALKKGGRRQSP